MEEDLNKEISDEQLRLIGSLCNSGYCKNFKEASNEVSDFMDNIIERNILMRSEEQNKNKLLKKWEIDFT